MLGLTHNFAASLAITTSLKASRQAFDSYVRTGKHRGAGMTTSSVLDYEGYEEGVLTGERVLSAKKALPYDPR